MRGGKTSRSTHGGAVVFKLTGEGPRYLLVEASGTRNRWVFPKGHVENGETTADTALREVAEEAGVRGRLVRRLRRVEQKQEGESISIVYFLLAYAGRTTPLEKRRIRWLTFDEAVEALDLVKSRRVLRSADRMISLATGRSRRDIVSGAPPHASPNGSCWERSRCYSWRPFHSSRRCSRCPPGWSWASPCARSCARSRALPPAMARSRFLPEMIGSA